MYRLAAWLAATGDGGWGGVGGDAGAARDGAASTTTAADADTFAPFFPLLGIWDEGGVSVRVSLTLWPCLRRSCVWASILTI
jgi:hypothetical protein